MPSSHPKITVIILLESLCGIQYFQRTLRVHHVTHRKKSLKRDALQLLIAADIDGDGLILRFLVAQHDDIRNLVVLIVLDLLLHVGIRIVRLKADAALPERCRDLLRVLVVLCADRYDADANTCVERANERVTKSTEERFAKTVSGYTSVTPESTRINLENGTAKYALFPVWILNTVWNKQTYTFAMNGQTGKFVGDLPMDKGIYRKWLFGIAGLISAAVFALLYLFWLI